MPAKLSITDQLTQNVTRRDERANVELAELIAKRNDFDGINEVVAGLGDRKLQADCIKILYEVAERRPELVAPHAEVFLQLLGHKNNRMVWGAMCAIDAIAALRSDLVYSYLDRLSEVTEKGTVITRDHFVIILVKLAATKEGTIPLVLGQLASAPVNQFPMYAERAAPLFRDRQRDEFIAIVIRRLPEMNTEAKRKRLAKVLKQLT
jgi:hypothetical protein